MKRLITFSMSYFFCFALLFTSVVGARVNKPAIYPYGVFKPDFPVRSGNQAASQNNRFSCTFDIRNNTGSERELTIVEFYDGDRLLFLLKDAPGRNISISNSGYIVFSEFTAHEGGDLILHMYSKHGTNIGTRRFSNAFLSGFSHTGNQYFVGTTTGSEVISLSSNTTKSYPTMWQFDISRDERFVALGCERDVKIFKDGMLMGTIPHTIPYFRKIRFSPDNKFVGFIGKNELFVYALPTFSEVIAERVSYEETGYTDIRLSNSRMWVGIHERNREENSSTGILRTYDLSAKTLISENRDALRFHEPMKKLRYTYNQDKPIPEFPWPFKPMDKPCKLWNSYLQLSSPSDGNTSGAYSHQGLDMDVPTNAPTVNISEEGHVVLHLTLGGALYWRVAVTEELTSDSCEAWLYAHLVQSSIQVQIGDKVKRGDFLGEIIKWSGLSGGHIHFSRLKGKGQKWNSVPRNYSNPALYLKPTGDTEPPKILNAESGSKFAFMTNDGAGSPKYVKANELKGDVDIIVKVEDKCGESPWLQEATTIYYWIKNVQSGKTVIPKTMALCRNQGMKSYSGNEYNTLAPVMHRIDSKFPVKGWFTKKRVYGHIITNSSGDTVITVNDKKQALKTASFGDGTYRIVVEVGDGAGNITVDSQDVVFKNGITGTKQQMVKAGVNQFYSLKHSGNYAITFQIPNQTFVSITLTNVKGREIATLTKKRFEKGTHTIAWNGMDKAGKRLPTGTYLYSFKTQAYAHTSKIAMIH